jgi:hypothetical protein
MFYVSQAKKKEENVNNPFVRKCVRCENVCECVNTDLGDLCVLCFKSVVKEKKLNNTKV